MYPKLERHIYTYKRCGKYERMHLWEYDYILQVQILLFDVKVENGPLQISSSLNLIFNDFYLKSKDFYLRLNVFYLSLTYFTWSSMSFTLTSFFFYIY